MSATSYEQLPAGSPPSADEARLTLVGDFYASFRFSQGAADIQRGFFTLLSTTYSKLWTPEGMQEVVPEAIALAQPAAEGIRPPSRHRNMESDKVPEEAAKQWSVFSDRLQTQAAKPPLTDRQFGKRSALLSRGLPLWDMRHLVLGRYNRDSDEVTHESLYRKHVLDGQPTRSQAFDIIFASLRARQLRRSPNMCLMSLKAGWDAHHKGEEFYPDSYLGALREGPFYAKALHASPLLGINYIISRAVIYARNHTGKQQQFQQNKDSAS